MTYSEMKDAVIRYAKEADIQLYDLYYSRGASTSIKAYEGEIETFADRTSIGLCFRCIIDGKTGYSHTQLLSDGEARRLVKDAKNCASVIENDEFSALFTGSESYEDVPQSEETSCDVNALKEMALEIERLAKAKDSRIVSVSYAGVSFSYGETAIYNSHGLDLRNRQSQYSVACQVEAESDGTKYIGYDDEAYLTASDMDIPKVVDTAVSLAIGSIGGKTVKSGTYPIVFSNKMMAAILGTFAGIFSGDAVQKGMSLLKDKEETAIASPLLTLVDDPFLAQSPNKSAFDDEGVATYKKNVIEKGVLKTLLYDLKSAAKAGKQSTGSGFKASYSSDVGVQPMNLHIQAGELNMDEILVKGEGGLYITELKGMHASANAATGDFSLEAKGYVIGKGGLGRPAEQFTIAGNFYKLLENIEAIGNDLALDYGVGAPTVLVSSLSVAGENEGE